jgi:hypothetical protein
MKLSTTTVATASVLLSSETCAARAGRNRKVKIYSSSSHLRKAVKDDVVDPFLALPDERAQRGLQELCFSMSLSSSTGSVATTIGSLPLTLLEMSMPLQEVSMSMSMSMSMSSSIGSIATAVEWSMPATFGSVPVMIGSVPTVQVGATSEVMAGEENEESIAMTFVNAISGPL